MRRHRRGPADSARTAGRGWSWAASPARTRRCSLSRVSTSARTRSSSGAGLACRLDLTSRADHPAVALPSTNGRRCEAGAHLGNVGGGQDIGDGEDHCVTLAPGPRGGASFDSGSVYTAGQQERGLTPLRDPSETHMAKLTRKLWVGIGAATIVGASFAGATAAQDPAQGPRAAPPAAGKGATDNPDAGRRGLPHRRRPARHPHPLLPRHRADARPHPRRRPADRARALGRGAAALPAPDRGALRADGEIHQAARHPPLPAASCRRWPRPSRPSARAPTSRR